MDISNIADDIAFVLICPDAIIQATRAMRGSTLGQIKRITQSVGDGNVPEGLLVFYRIIKAAASGNSAAQSCLNFYLDEAKRSNNDVANARANVDFSQHFGPNPHPRH